MGSTFDYSEMIKEFEKIFKDQAYISGFNPDFLVNDYDNNSHIIPYWFMELILDKIKMYQGVLSFYTHN